ncbi:DNA sulfur modification protein DndB [Streptomyces californicus]|uniref:DNA sulfur modification protein DndB n=1 Tax=Streptomyces californicus TaxID=67351 RepID=UPI0033D01021
MTFQIPDLGAAGSSLGQRPIRAQRIGLMSNAGKLSKITWSEPAKSLAELWNFQSLIRRNDYDINDTSQPGQRDIHESHLKKIADGIRNSDQPYLGTMVVGMAYDSEFVKIEQGAEVLPGVHLVKVTIYEGAPAIYSVDGQHRERALCRVWAEVQDATDGHDLAVRERIEQSAVEMTLVLEGDPDSLSSLFIKMASTKPISPSLIAVMDKTTKPNRLGQHVIQKAKLFNGRVTYLANAAHKNKAAESGRAFEGLYPAAAVRSAASAIAGVGVRDRSPEIREAHLEQIVKNRTVPGSSADETLMVIGDEVVEIMDYAFERIPGWREIAKGELTVGDFRQQYLHSAAAGLHVIANAIAAAKIANLSPLTVVDALTELPWRRDALQTSSTAKKASGLEDRLSPLSHVLFEGTLAKTVWDPRTGKWWASASGATRAGYEAAINTVLHRIAQDHQDLKSIASDETFTELGLMARKRGPGRPRKVTATAPAAK